MFRPRGRCPRTPARGRGPWTPRSFFHGQRGSPPVTPPPTTVPTQNDGGYRWGRTETPHSGHTREGWPGEPSFLRRTESRSTFLRPSATLRQPALLRFQFRPGTPRYAGGRGGVPRGETVKRTRGSRGRQPPCGGLEAAPPGPEVKVCRIPPRTWRCRSTVREPKAPASTGPSEEFSFRSALRGPKHPACPHSSEDFRCGSTGRTARAAASDASGPQPEKPILLAVPPSNRLLLLN